MMTTEEPDVAASFRKRRLCLVLGFYSKHVGYVFVSLLILHVPRGCSFALNS